MKKFVKLSFFILAITLIASIDFTLSKLTFKNHLKTYTKIDRQPIQYIRIEIINLLPYYVFEVDDVEWSREKLDFRGVVRWFPKDVKSDDKWK